MRRRTFLQMLSLVFVPIARAPVAQTPAEHQYRDSVGTDAGTLATLLRDGMILVGVSYAAN